MEVPESHTVRLSHSFVGGQTLHNEVTGEFAAIDGDCCELAFDEQGWGVLRWPRTGAERHCCEVLQRKLCSSEDGSEHYVLAENGDLVLFTDYIGEHRRVALGISFLKGMAQKIVQAWWFTRRQAGANLWLDLQSLHRALALPGTPHRWYQNQWNKWETWLTHASLPSLHLRRAAATRKSGVEAQCSQDDQARMLPVTRARAMPKCALTAHALLCLVCRYPAPSRGRVQKNPADVARWRAFGDSLFGNLPSERFVVHFDLDPRAECDSCGTRGPKTHVATVVVEGGSASLESDPLLRGSRQSRLVAAFLCGYFGDGPRPVY